MYKKYYGNSGQFISIKETEDMEPNKTESLLFKKPLVSMPDFSINSHNAAAANTNINTVGLSALGGMLSSLKLDSADIILCLLFLYLYLQTSDWEFLVLLGALVVL